MPPRRNAGILDASPAPSHEPSASGGRIPAPMRLAGGPASEAVAGAPCTAGAVDIQAGDTVA